MIYWTPDSGAHAVTRAIAAVWAYSGYEQGEYGYPTSESKLNQDADIVQSFSKRTLNLRDFFISTETKIVGAEVLSTDLIDFARKYVDPAMFPEGEISVQSLRAGDPFTPENGTIYHAGILYRLVSPIGIPDNYVYDSSISTQNDLNDFCSYSPDYHFSTTILSLNRAADFRGPCANHDTCYLGAGYDFRKVHCDPPLRDELKSTCRAAFPNFEASRYSCVTMAEAMYQAVKHYQAVIH